MKVLTASVLAAVLAACGSGSQLVEFPVDGATSGDDAPVYDDVADVSNPDVGPGDSNACTCSCGCPDTGAPDTGSPDAGSPDTGSYVDSGTTHDSGSTVDSGSRNDSGASHDSGKNTCEEQYDGCIMECRKQHSSYACNGYKACVKACECALEACE